MIYLSYMELLSILSEFYADCSNNKEFIVLFGVFLAVLKLILATKDNTSAMKIQHATCGGRFDTQDIKIENIQDDVKESKKISESAKEESGNAKKTADKAFDCVERVSKKVDGLVKTVDEAKQEFTEKYKQYTEDKHMETLTKPEK